MFRPLKRLTPQEDSPVFSSSFCLARDVRSALKPKASFDCLLVACRGLANRGKLITLAGRLLTGKRQVANLPGDVTDAVRRLAKPLSNSRLVQQANRVVAGEQDLLDGKLQPRHVNYSFFAGIQGCQFAITIHPGQEHLT